MIELRNAMASFAIALLVLCIAPTRGDAAPYAALVMDFKFIMIIMMFQIMNTTTEV